MSSKNEITSVLQLQQSTIIRAFLQATSREFAGLTTAQIMNTSTPASTELWRINNVVYDGNPAMDFSFGGGVMIASLTHSPDGVSLRYFLTNNTDSWTETTWER